MNKLPVVAYDLGSAQEFVINNKTGYLIKKYDVREFANGIKKIIANDHFDFDKKIFNDIKNKCSSQTETKKLIKLAYADLARKRA